MQKEILDLNGIKAVIFDMDGTMIDNMPYHNNAWLEFCKRHGLDFSREEFKERFSGRKNGEILSTIFGRKLTADEIQQYIDEKEGIYREIYAPNIREVGGLRNIIDEFKNKGIKLAIATTAPESNREFGLKSLGLSGEFEVILGDEHVSNGKPNPGIYLETAKQLDVEPSNCIVFEDSPVGVQAAKSAGMRVVGILTTHTRDELKNSDLFREGFNQLEII